MSYEVTRSTATCNPPPIGERRRPHVLPTEALHVGRISPGFVQSSHGLAHAATHRTEHCSGFRAAPNAQAADGRGRTGDASAGSGPDKDFGSIRVLQQ
ncbi:hypothetical protein OPT61_g7021 [Boeremia exigua]|uniref:Uncharacterized protein n=1 Tax=Boeremia exigua TaxID=749465 RepID=A0ACC2I3V5_9PLEO|nr:hypothetical protein OPT61_g7021 [Boeremia exigua]